MAVSVNAAPKARLSIQGKASLETAGLFRFGARYFHILGSNVNGLGGEIFSALLSAWAGFKT